MKEVQSLLGVFTEVFGPGAAPVVVRAPGRVNLIGEHTDYNEGFVLPVAVDFSLFLAARRRKDRQVKAYAVDRQELVSFSLEDSFSYDHDHRWSNYLQGVLRVLQHACARAESGEELPGIEVAFTGKIPPGAGLASSAALEVATALAVQELNGLSFDRPALARICQQAENEFAGVNCGIMDQFSSALGKKDNAIFLDCKDLSYSYVPLRLKDKKIIIANTNKKRSLQTSKYNERKAECDAALGQFKMVLPEKEFLGTVTVEEYLQYKKLLIIDETIRKRAKHVIFECDRVLKSVNALEKGDINTFGELMIQSHYSLRELYEVTGVELDTLVEEALKIKGVIGSRMTGAGFGGCTVSIVEDGAVDRFINTVGKAYANKIGYDATFYISDIGDGVREIYI